MQSEREAAMRAAGAKFKERKRKEALPQKSRLVGAALQAFARREERERLAKEAARAESGEAAQDVKDVEMKAEAGEDKTGEVKEEQKEEEEDQDAPKRDIPSCKYDAVSKLKMQLGRQTSTDLQIRRRLC